MEITGVYGLAPTAGSAPAPAPSDQLALNRDLVQAVKAVNTAGSLGDSNELTFLLDRATRLPVIRIVNRETREVVDQIPPEFVLRLAEELRQRK